VENSTRIEFCKAAECSEEHLSNILAGRKAPSLKLAARLSRATGGMVPIEAFLQTEAAE
jgi:transcriptional regulator with XRE-family HTH domain